MAAALFRGGTGPCVRCIHRELCRVVWRSQAAMFSSKPSDRKPPRITHIKKAKAQPAVDVAKLLEQLFSQTRPDTAPPAAAPPAKASSMSTKPPTTSSVKISTSKVPRLSKAESEISVFPAASVVSKKTTSTFNTSPLSPQPKSASSKNPETSFSSEMPQQSPLGFIQEFAADGVSSVTAGTASASPPTSTTPAPSGSEAAIVDSQTSAETRETKVEAATEADELSAAPVLPLSAHMVETNAEKSSVPSATEPSADSSITPLETLNDIAAVLEETVKPTIEAEADKEGHSMTVEPLIETAVDPSVEASPPPMETLETRASVPEGAVESTVEAEVDTAAQTNSTDSGVINISHAATVEPLLESTVEPSVEAITSTQAAVVESIKEPTIETEGGDNLSHSALIQNAHESAVLPLRNEVESTVESSSENVAVGDEVNESEQMTLESVTLHLVKDSVESLKTDELLQTKFILDEKAEERLQELLVRSGVTAEHRAAAEAEKSSEDEGEIITKVLSKWDSLSEDLKELEGETGALVKDLLCRVPAALSKTPGTDTTEAEVLALDFISEATDAIEAETFVMLEAMFGSEQGPRQPPDAPLLKLERQNETTNQEAEKEPGEQEGRVLEAMSMESVTLAEVEASLGTLEDMSLSDTAAYLENEAEIFAGERWMEVEEETVSEEMIEVLNVESLSLPEADGLSEDLQTDALMEELLFIVPGHVAGGKEARVGQEVLGADILDATVATGSETDATEAPKEVLLGRETVEKGAQTEALGNEKGVGTHTDLDPVQRLFLEKIREYNNMRRLSGGQVGAEPDYERYLSEETAKLQRLYGGGDLSSFPEFTFTGERDSEARERFGHRVPITPYITVHIPVTGPGSKYLSFAP
ncbi:uncharacterized protein LOC121189317 isoform X2 [Toxotes jaculatrix]|uniref:uncharacterized protein LOC121189317 isoform X2 n=1 Tax=Toxotes jaculatrix TaxID=941984 RepID=UPI001B3AFACA|nr:uncharacterized protein LOC121189317 isoform X2 [Toxotes jaculatrix]